MKYLLIALTLCWFGSATFAQDPSWLRYPALSPDGKTIVFTYKGDLYRVAATGGTAVPLTLHAAHDFMPVWSPDGKSIAFASDRYGNFDVFVMPAEGGTARRITFHSTSEYPYSFSPDGKQVLFGASRLDAPENRQYPARYMSELYAVSTTGGRVSQVLTTPADNIAFSKDGSRFLYQDKKGGENDWRKHQTSSVARDIWMYNTKSGAHTQLTQFAGEDRNPVFAPGEKGFYYLSEESGSFNVHYKEPASDKSRQLTRFRTHPVRFLSGSTDGTLCFSYDGSIYTLREGAEPRKVPITLNEDGRYPDQQVYRVTGGRGMSVSPNGKEIAFLYRGDVFVSSIEGGSTRRITHTPEEETGLSFSPDGKALIFASERNHRWGIYEVRISRKEESYFYASTLLTETPLMVNNNGNTQPLYSPDGKEVAFIENRVVLKVYNLASKQTRVLLTGNHLFSGGENDQYFQWSPDNKWILFEYAVPGSAAGDVGLVSADGSRIENLSQSGFSDYRPRWILGGKAMLWFSTRDGLRAASMSGSKQADAYALFFSKEAFDRFRLSKEEAALKKEAEEAQAKADTSKKKAAKDSVVIDWDDLEFRKTKLTIHSSSLADALVSKDGETLYYLARFEQGFNLWTTNLRTRETKMLVTLNAPAASMEWDKEQKNIFINSGSSFLKVDPNSGKQDRIAVNGEMIVDVLKERRFLFDHVWRRTKNTFYTQSFHGVNWDLYKTEYEKYLPHIGNNHELSELLSELLGELNVSHSGSGYSNMDPNGDNTASLGIFYDYNFKGNGVRVLEVIKGGPLDKAGFNIKPGTIIESIDGERISPDKDLAQYLNRKAGAFTLLGIVEGTTRRELTIKPITLGDESRLLYQRWVKRNADEVEQLSNGQLGYVHIPGMDDGSFRITFSDIMGKHFSKKAMVVDTRNNGGGDLVADLAVFLSGKKFMDYGIDNRLNGYEPNFQWTKPSISLVNEANYSDGHCYAFMIKELGIGKLVGMPVPGTCTFGGWEALMDSGIRWGVPAVGCKDVRGNYLENNPTQPQLLIRNEQERVATGTDQQLVAAVKELLKGL